MNPGLLYSNFDSAGNAAPTAPTGAGYAMLSHPAYWASDASHIIPCNAGDAIRWWKDAVTGTWYEQATSGSRAIARLDATGKWYAESTASTLHPWVDLSTQPSDNFTLAAAYRPTGSTGNPTLSRGTLNRAIDYSVAPTPRILYNNNGSAILASSSDTLGNDYRLIAQYAKPNATLYRNGTSVASLSNDTSTNNVGVITVSGFIGQSSFGWLGRIYGIVVYLNGTTSVPALDTALHGYCPS